MKVKGFVRSRMRESRTYGSVRGGYRKVSVYSIVRTTMINERMQQRAKDVLISVSDRLEKAGDPALNSQLK